MQQRRHRPTRKSGGAAPGEVCRHADVGNHRLQRRSQTADDSPFEHVARCILLLRVRRVVEQNLRQRDAADSVGEGVVDLLDERRPSTLHTFDHGEFPQRPVFVERCHCHRRCHIEHSPKVTWRRDDDTAQVIVEVELFVELPPRRPEMEGNRRHLLPEPRNLPAGVGEPITEALKIRATVEQRDCDDRAS